MRAPGARALSRAEPQPTRLTRKRKTAGVRSTLPARVAGTTRTTCRPTPKRRDEARRPQKRSRPRSTLQTKVDAGSLEAKRKTARARGGGGSASASAGAWRCEVRGATVSTAKLAVPLTADPAGEVDAADGEAVARRRASGVGQREGRSAGLRGAAVDRAGEGDRAVGAELDPRRAVAAERRAAG